MKLRANWKKLRKQMKYIKRKNKIARHPKLIRTLQLNSEGYLSLDGGKIKRSEHTVDAGTWESHYGIKRPFKVIMPSFSTSGLMTGTEVDEEAYKQMVAETRDDIGRKLGIHPDQVILDDPIAKDLTIEKNWQEFHKQYTIPGYDQQSLISRKIAQKTGISEHILLGTQRGVINGSEVEENGIFHPPLPEIKNAEFHDGAWTIRNVTIQKRAGIGYIGFWEENIFSDADEDVSAAIKGYSVGYSGNGRVT